MASGPRCYPLSSAGLHKFTLTSFAHAAMVQHFFSRPNHSSRISGMLRKPRVRANKHNPEQGHVKLYVRGTVQGPGGSRRGPWSSVGLCCSLLVNGVVWESRARVAFIFPGKRAGLLCMRPATRAYRLPQALPVLGGLRCLHYLLMPLTFPTKTL